MNRSNINTYINMPIEDLLTEADKVRRENGINNIDLCGIVNAKSGACSEDCKFCAQSCHYKTRVDQYDLISSDLIVHEAGIARSNSASRFGIVTSGNRLNKDEIFSICDAVKRIIVEVDIDVCASLGALDEDDLVALKDAGLKRYHHNIETSESYYPRIVSSHAYSERIITVMAAKKAGFEVCSGGIIGIGESWDDRVDMAYTLKDLDVDSIPINILVPIKGTPMEGITAITASDVIRTIAIFRLILPDKTIKVAAGRESALKDHQDMIYRAGANGMMIGGYLTVAGRSVSEDLELVEKVSRSWKRP